MRTVTHREMRNNSAELLRAVAAGESVQVTNNGQVAAVISPPGEDALAVLTSRGQARPARAPLGQLRSVRRRRVATRSVDIIADARGRW